jgi:hypothetical protein
MPPQLSESPYCNESEEGQCCASSMQSGQTYRLAISGIQMRENGMDLYMKGGIGDPLFLPAQMPPPAAKLTTAAPPVAPPLGHSSPSPQARTLIVVYLREATGWTHQNALFGCNMAFWFHPNLRAKFPSLILTGKREPPFPPNNIAPRHPPNHTLLVMCSIFRTEEVGVIRPNHRVWALF